ncbi:MAG: DNA primase [Ruminococcaceae bacterium]|nr:DNA primase [Oscillospiraceae bacterium]
MPMFPEYLIREVAEKNDIYDVVSRSVSLKKTGSSYIGLCPFHNEKTPSFSVSPRRGIFKCFGCGEGGDVIGFVMKNENLSFYDAVAKLASNAGIQLPEIKKEEVDRDRKRKEKSELLYAINKDAAEFFYNNVKTSQSAIDYFKKRQLDGRLVKYFWLGYAPESWTALFDYLKEKGYTESDIYDAGLIRRHESGRYYDYFRNRVMFTIFDANSNIIGFGGRVLDDSKPKYLNSPDSTIFSKGKNLYSLNIARHSKKSFCILCEGYMDAISIITAGHENTVATLGTAIGEHQAKTISRYFEEVVICYDSDSAGRNATNRAISVLRSQPKLKISVLDLKGKKDPDEYIKTYGKARFDALLAKRQSDMEYLIEYFGEQYNLKKSTEIVSYISELSNYLRLIPSSVELDVYAGIIAEKTGVQPSSVIAQVGVKRAGNSSSPGGNSDIINVVGKGTAVSDDREYLEKTRALLLSTLFYDRKLYGKYASAINEKMFENPIHILMYGYIKECFEKGENPSQTSLISKFEIKEDINTVSGILALDVQSDDTDRAVSDYINQIKQKGGTEKALRLLQEGAISLEEFNAMINNKG